MALIFAISAASCGSATVCAPSLSGSRRIAVKQSAGSTGVFFMIGHNSRGAGGRQLRSPFQTKCLSPQSKFCENRVNDQWRCKIRGNPPNTRSHQTTSTKRKLVMNRESKGSFRLRAATRRTASGALALAMVGALAMSAIMPVAADTKSKAAKSGLTDDQKIIHLLNRIGFGPRPGDVERVKRMGIDKYIDLQLHPERIDDSAIEARLANFPSLRMSLAEIQDKYPAPNVLARELGLKQGKNAKLQPPPGDGADENAKREYRQQVMAYYQENGLKPPQLLLQELQGQKIVRAAYSERQLQEVMTDFWFNHFNIFWAKNLDRDL